MASCNWSCLSTKWWLYRFEGTDWGNPVCDPGSNYIVSVYNTVPNRFPNWRRNNTRDSEGPLQVRTNFKRNRYCCPFASGCKIFKTYGPISKAYIAVASFRLWHTLSQVKVRFGSLRTDFRDFAENKVEGYYGLTSGCQELVAALQHGYTFIYPHNPAFPEVSTVSTSPCRSCRSLLYGRIDHKSNRINRSLLLCSGCFSRTSVLKGPSISRNLWALFVIILIANAKRSPFQCSPL